MRKHFLFLCPLFFAFGLMAQLPEDALRLSYTNPSGTAREQAIGGAMGSLGGDVSANFVNPAGLGFYKTSEFLLSPAWGFQKTKSQYLSTNEPGPNLTHFMLGTSGLVLGKSTTPDKSSAFSFAINRSADFYSHTRYNGKNNYSSAAEAYAEEFVNSGVSFDQALKEPGISYGTRMAIFNYLIDTATIGGITQVIAQPQKVLIGGGQLYQLNDIKTTGGITELAFGFASNSYDKWYLGASIGIPIVNYQRDTRYTESDLSGNTNNDFNSYTYTETYSSKGAGVNLKLGAIFRPNTAWRVGFAVHTPTLYSLTDRLDANLVSNLDNYRSTPGVDSVSSRQMNDLSGSGNSLKYDLSSSWHFIASGSYVFGTGEDTKAQQGFITGDIEYVTNKSPRFSLPSDYNSYSSGNSYYDGLNNTVKNYYKNSFNFRLGGELKFNTLSVRAGGSYSLSPFAASAIKVSRASVGGGLGYRNHGIFVDLTFVESFIKEASFPYRLSDKDNVYATVNQNTGNLILTVGVKF